MIDKKTIFVLGAGASCPYGYPSGTRLRELICLDQGFWRSYNEYLKSKETDQNKRENRLREVNHFRQNFEKSGNKSIDVFMANNSKLAPIGKYIIAYEVFRAERRSLFGERAKWAQEEREMPTNSRPIRREYILGTADFQGGDWYFYIYNRLIEGLEGKDTLPDLSNGNLAFITFNYDRSLEQFFYEALRNSFTQVSEDKIVQSLKQLKILHVYGQIALLKWQNPEDYVDYKPQIDESSLERAAENIRTIYEEKQNPELAEAQNLLKQAERIFFLGFGYAPENMEILRLPESIPPTSCKVYGTAFGLIEEEVRRIYAIVHGGRKYEKATKIESSDVDCLMLLRKYLN